MVTLVPCPSCARHVRTDEAACPFCGSAERRPDPPPARNVLGVSRAMLFVGATTLAACGKEPAPPPAPPPPPIDNGSLVAAYGAPAPMYGAPPDMMTAPVPVPTFDAGATDGGPKDAGPPKKPPAR